MINNPNPAADSFVRRPPAWKQFEPLDIACAAALGVEPSQVGSDLLLVHGTIGAPAPQGAPCPLVVIETFRGVAVRVYDPLRRAVERVVREGMKRGGVLSRANRERLQEIVAARLPLAEVWHDLLHFTDRPHFLPLITHRVRRTKIRRTGDDQPDTAPYAAAYGTYVKGELAAYADVAIRGDYACSIGVFTESPFRGRGLGTSVASAATRAILKAGRIPLYSAESSNAPSLAICRSLGYLKFGEDMYCFMPSEEERAEEWEEQRRAADVALRRWMVD